MNTQLTEETAEEFADRHAAEHQFEAQQVAEHLPKSEITFEAALEVVKREMLKGLEKLKGGNAEISLIVERIYFPAGIRSSFRSYQIDGGFSEKQETLEAAIHFFPSEDEKRARMIARVRAKIESAHAELAQLESEVAK